MLYKYLRTYDSLARLMARSWDGLSDIDFRFDEELELLDWNSAKAEQRLS